MYKLFIAPCLFLLLFVANNTLSDIKIDNSLISSIDKKIPTTTTNEHIPTDLFFKEDENRLFALSSDGRMLASVKHKQDKNLILIYDIKKEEVTSVNDIGKYYPSTMRWKGSKLIIEAESQIIEIADGNTAVRKLLGFNDKIPNGKTNGIALWRILSSLEQDPEYILVSVRSYYGGLHKVYRYNLFTGELIEKINLLKGPEGTSWYFNNEGELIAGIKYKKNKFNIYSYSDGKFKLLSSIDMPNKYKTPKQGMSYLSNRIHFEYPSNKKNIIYISHNLHSDRFIFSEFNIQTGKFGDTIFESEKYDVGGLTGYLRPLHNGDIAGVSYYKGKLHTEWSNKSLTKHQLNIDKKFPDANNHIIDYSNNMSVLLFESTGERNGKVYLYNTKEDSYVLYSKGTPELEDYTIAHEKIIHYIAKDGTQHEGYLSLPLDSSKDTHKTIILPSPHKWTRDSLGFSPWAKFFVSNGYAVLRLNYRGTSGYGRDYFTSGIKNQFALATSDIHDATQWLIDEKISEKSNIYIFGSDEHSGFLSLLTAKRYPELYQGIAAISAIVDVTDEYNDHKKSKNNWQIEYWNLALSGNKKAKKHMSYLDGAKENITPSLLFYGENNTLLTKADAKKYEKKSNHHTEILQVVYIDKEGDKINTKTNKVFIADSTLLFFEKIERRNLK